MDISLVTTLTLLLGGLASILVGISTLTGLGLIIYLTDLILLSPNINYHKSRKNYPPVKSFRGKSIAILLIIIGIVMIAHGFSIEQ